MTKIFNLLINIISSLAEKYLNNLTAMMPDKIVIKSKTFKEMKIQFLNVYELIKFIHNFNIDKNAIDKYE